MILMIKRGQFHKLKSVKEVVTIIHDDEQPLASSWMVKDSMQKHQKLFGWKLIKEGEIKK